MSMGGRVVQKVPLFYYSFNQKIKSSYEDWCSGSELLKVSIKKPFSRERGDYSIEVFDLRKRSVVEEISMPCSSIVEENDDHTFLLGREKLPVFCKDNKKCAIYWNNETFYILFGRCDGEDITIVENWFAQYNKNFFNLKIEEIELFIDSTYKIVSSFPQYDPDNLWFIVRFYLLKYYIKRYPNLVCKWYNTEEKVFVNNNNIANKTLIELLKTLEDIIDSQAIDLFSYECTPERDKYEQRLLESLTTYRSLYNIYTFDSPCELYRRDFVFKSHKMEIYCNQDCIRKDVYINIKASVIDDHVNFNLTGLSSDIIESRFTIDLSNNLNDSDILPDRIQYGRLPKETLGLSSIRPIVCNIFERKGCIRFALPEPLRIIEFYGEFE